MLIIQDSNLKSTSIATKEDLQKYIAENEFEINTNPRLWEDIGHAFRRLQHYSDEKKRIKIYICLKTTWRVFFQRQNKSQVGALGRSFE